MGRYQRNVKAQGYTGNVRCWFLGLGQVGLYERKAKEEGGITNPVVRPPEHLTASATVSVGRSNVSESSEIPKDSNF